MGLAMGLRSGLATGIGADAIRSGDAGPAWTVDATSGIATPANATEWAAFIAAKGLSVPVPDALWLFQDASGNATDAIGSFALTASGTGISYQQAVSGWSRKAISFTDGGTGAFTSTSASLPDVSTTSTFTVVFAQVNATPAGLRALVTQGTTTTDQMLVNTTPRLRLNSGANAVTGTVSPTGAVRPFALRTNRTAGSATAFSDAEKISPTFSTSITGKKLVISAGAPISAVYAFEWHGANAEISDANYKALLQAMGLTIAW